MCFSSATFGPNLTRTFMKQATQLRPAFLLRSAALLLTGLLLAGGWGTGAAQAQTTTVSGTVSDEGSGSSIPGVNVAIANSTIGTTTDVEGRYELELPPDQRTLVFSFIGYQTREVEVPEGQTQLDVALTEDVVGLDEVVVTGLASSVKRSNLANSVATVSGEELTGRTTQQTLDGALSGKVTGAEVSSYTGAPGGGMSIKMRGVSTINGNSQPLYIVDGVVVNNSSISSGVNAVTAAAGGGNASSQDNPVNRIADLNPQDIASIEILKGPSAAAIYGGRAANGVVLITTKQGRAGRTEVNFSQTLGVTTISNRLGVREFTEETALATYAPDAPADATPGEVQQAEEQKAFIRNLYQEAEENGFVDYEEELFGNEGLLSTTSLSASGGTESTKFFVSGLVKDDGGIVERTGYEKQSVRANLTHDISQRAQVSVNTNYIHSTTRRGLTGNDNSGTTFGVALTSTPNFIDLRPNENGVYPDHPFNASNPLQTRDLFTNEETVNRIIGGADVRYNLLTTERQSLQAVLEGGVDFFNLQSEALFPRILQFERSDPEGVGTSIFGQTSSLNTNLRGILVHSLNVPGSNLQFSTQLGLTGANFDQNVQRVFAEELVPDQQNVDQAGVVRTQQTRQFQTDRSFFVQEEINYDDRLIFSAGLRGDRSSLSGDVEAFNLYPKVSLAANLTNFPFWGVDDIDQFKLRAAFGQTGNIAGFGIKFTSFGAATVGGNVASVIGRTRGSDEVEPERQSEIEGGFDIAVFDGRANLDFTVYQKTIFNQLLLREVPSSTGFGFETINAGNLVNQGLEVGLTVLPVNQENFRWQSRTSFWTNEATVEDLPVPAFQASGGGFGTTLGEIRIEEGKSPTQIVGIDGENGVVQLGDAAPDFQMSFSNDFTFFRNLSLTFLGHWKKGGDNINLSELLFDLNGTSPDYDDDDNGNGVPDGDDRVAQLGVSAAQFVQNASYFRIREVGLYYNLPESFLGSALSGAVRSLRVGVSANNLLTITPYKSYDPEVNNFGTQPVASGVEVTPYPSSRQFLFHLGVGL